MHKHQMTMTWFGSILILKHGKTFFNDKKCVKVCILSLFKIKFIFKKNSRQIQGHLPQKYILKYTNI